MMSYLLSSGYSICSYDLLSIVKKKKIAVLGICFGHQLLAVAHGAILEAGGNPEYGDTAITLSEEPSILKGLHKEQIVWMSHSDQVTQLPEGMVAMATSGDGHIAAFRRNDDQVFGVQFHPEVTHTPNGLEVLKGTDPLDPLSYPGSGDDDSSTTIILVIAGCGGVAIVLVIVFVMKRRKA